MSLPDCDRFRAEILAHFGRSRPDLSPEAQAHYADCEHCIAAVTEQLDKGGATPKVRTRGVNAGQSVGPDLSNLPPEARRALEHGRAVIERELGMSFSPDSQAVPKQ